MPRSWTQNYYHIIFSTKKREQKISVEMEQRVYPFIRAILTDLRCVTLEINGMPDHLHALVRYPPDLSHSELLQRVKGGSSRWMGEIFSTWRGWQEGFGGFTVSTSKVEEVAAYIRNQKQHHLKRTYEEEVIELHRLNGLEFVAEDVLD